LIAYEDVLRLRAGSLGIKEVLWEPSAVMRPLQQLLNQQSFGPDEIKVLSSVFEEALRELRLVDRTDPATLLVAKRIMNLRSRASVIPTRLREGAVKGF